MRAEITDDEIDKKAQEVSDEIEDTWTPEYYTGIEQGFRAGAYWAIEELGKRNDGN